jgi:Domain of unknown function (DUF4340)
MKTSTLLSLCGLCAALCLFAYSNGWLNPPTPTTPTLPDWQLAPETVQRISISQNGKRLEFYKENEVWKNDSLAIESADADSFLVALSNLKIAQQVSNKIEEQSVYGFSTADSVIQVRLLGSFGSKNLYFTPPKNGVQYLRIAENLPIYKLEKPINIPQSAHAWQDRTVLLLDINTVDKIKVNRPEEQFTLFLEDEEWVLETDSSVVLADSIMVMDWLDRFSPLKADGYAPVKQPYTLQSRPQITLTFYQKDVVIKELSLVFWGGEKWYVNPDKVFYVNPTTLHHLLPNAEIFIQPDDTEELLQEAPEIAPRV